MIEFLAARWGKWPWEVARVPMVVLKEWYPAAIENVVDEGAAGIAKVLENVVK